jgi:photosystem II stability/assembly factor-like uncharacterized protein
MMKNALLLLLLVTCSAVAQKTKISIYSTESGASFRSLSVVNDTIVWVAGSKGVVCRSEDACQSFQCAIVSGYDSTEFRSLYAFDDKIALIANVGSPAHILRTADGGQTWDVVYENTHADAFLDGIDFWNKFDGICYGDPINGKMMVLRTRDGGLTWNELLGDSKPLLAEGEASFAASGTAIRCYDNSTVIVATGGELSRLLISKDNATTWRTIVAPIIQGREGTGIFSVDFYDENNAIIVGGDYKNDTLTQANNFYTTDGGISWNAPENTTRGYRECVQYINQNNVVAIGPGGMDVSYNGGKNWQKLSDEKKFHVLRKSRNGQLLVIAGGDGKVGVLELEK